MDRTPPYADFQLSMPSLNVAILPQQPDTAADMINAVSSNAISSSLAGLQQAQSRMDQAAASLADPNAAASVTTLSEAAVAMKVASIVFKANVEAIKAENDTLGALIDTMA